MDETRDDRGRRTLWGRHARDAGGLPAWPWALLLFLPLLAACEARHGVSLVEQAESMRVGQVLRLDKAPHGDNGLACVLYPYQPRVAGPVPQAGRINAYLEMTGYTADEGHWAFVFARPEGVDVIRFSRSGRLDILSAREAQSGEPLPGALRPDDCVPLHKAALAKVRQHGRTLVVLGEY
ncbi:hypothetical protein IP92_01448 [Pseudoduganella flava]|uniref:Uncharacterized protein n=1 Tax=Pseudoduganella flava TaxID=871742 RepID=A0A562Q0L9_9BURK|nr:hypothetical protein [Pseudoduganella flava]QGZ38248.1 hypothetical protein GO485_03740 [Pseudoduganella flava]TWI50219.1 hypothetical protein IP92_01448 [Pseudoduganella flava]